MIDTRKYQEILAGCLQIHAVRMAEASSSHFEPGGPQARAQASKAEELFKWSRAEMSSAHTTRDFATESVSKAEVASAILFAESEAEKLGALMTKELEKILGPLEEAVEKHKNSIEGPLPAELETMLHNSTQNKVALFYLRLAMDLLSPP